MEGIEVDLADLLPRSAIPRSWWRNFLQTSLGELKPLRTIKIIGGLFRGYPQGWIEAIQKYHVMKEWHCLSSTVLEVFSTGCGNLKAMSRKNKTRQPYGMSHKLLKSFQPSTSQFAAL